MLWFSLVLLLSSWTGGGGHSSWTLRMFMQMGDINIMREDVKGERWRRMD
uniref:RxLR effector candidate protein n=1 Tax=Hyaloperonospora arabidopsidis (strain Emoy2) TaxID=559515 RepID=M4BER0_HYAAE